MEHNRLEDARRSLDWIRGAPAETEFAALQAQLDGRPSHKVTTGTVDNKFLFYKKILRLSFDLGRVSGSLQ